MIDYADALQRLLAVAPAPVTERIATMQARGRILARDVRSLESLPPFDNSAMDGFALACGDVGLAAGAELDVRGERAAGDARGPMGEGACEVMTGAPVPSGLDGIVPVEQVDVVATDATGRPARIRLKVDVAAGQHVRRAGEDVAAGDRVLPAGRRLDAAACMLLVGLGVADVDVAAAAPVGLVTTGRELVDDPAAPLRDGQIRNTNGPFLAMRLEDAGARVVHRATVGDAADAFLAELGGAIDRGARVLVSTGAVSMGRYDFIPQALERLGAEVLFHRVRIRPGKPILAARLPGDRLFFGLPGNPASTAVGLRFFVEPVLRAMLGLPPEPVRRLPLAVAYAKRVPLRMHLKARVAMASDGRLEVAVLGGQESFRIRPLLDANAWAVIEAEHDALAAGTPVAVYSRGHLDPLEVA
ncbi:molybdopterin molybdotransferase MoeA [Lysobacter humi (ex Lee et al. 2017)]